MVSIDIENLKLFNEWYGWEEGDKLLLGIQECLMRQEEEKRIAGYFDNDNFAVLMPYDETRIRRLYECIAALLEPYSNKIGFLPSLGVYIIQDRNESVYTMYDRAELARAEIKGNYTARIKKFNTKMLEKLESAYVLFSDIQRGLKNREFTFFLQPKCNLENGNLIGAEALVRWNSQEKGMISPGVFIPFLERTGFIAELDPYIWEEVCKWQRSMIDRGYRPIPVSVNVSRADIYSMDIQARFSGLTEKYDISPRLIEIEITESIYTEDNEFINCVVKNLRKAGFRVLMDDFGSGYSSLNMLKDIEVDELKLDMRFLEINEDNAQKGIRILEAVYNMARLLGIDILVEGVETEAQKRFLLETGCRRGQGYYYYRPMQVQDFEKLIEKGVKLYPEEIPDKKTQKILLKDLLGEDMFSEVMINNMLGAVAFFEACKDEVSVTRYNDQYAVLTGRDASGNENYSPIDNFSREEVDGILQIFEKAKKGRCDGAKGDIHVHRYDGSDVWLQLHVFFLHEQDGRAVYYGLVSDITDIYKKNEMLRQQNEIMDFLGNEMPGGYYRHKYSTDCEFLHISNRFLEIVGFTREEIKEQFDDKFVNMMHPDDIVLLKESMKALGRNGGNYSQSYRIRSKSGYIMVTDQSRLVEYDGIQFFQGIILCDMEHYRQIKDKKDSGDKHWFNVMTNYESLKEKYREQEWQQMKYKTLAEIPGMIVYDYEPAHDRLNLEVSRNGGKIEIYVVEKFLKDIKKHSWLANASVDQQKKVIQEASLHPMSGTTEFRACFEENGEFNWYRSYFRSLADENGKVYRLVGRADNIEQDRRTISDWKKRSMRDSLTGLLNNESGKILISKAVKDFGGGSMMLLDIDDFKGVNDTLGHLQGDKALKKISAILKSQFRREDILIRMGGDEFLIFMPGMCDRRIAALKAEEIFRELRESNKDDTVQIHCSLGIAVSDEITESEKLIHQADVALYRAKAAGKDRYCFWSK